MAIQPVGSLRRTLEFVVVRPPLATLTVGGSILALMQAIGWLQTLDPRWGWLAWVVPFVPPFFITNIAKNLNQRRAEHDFIADAEPLVFVAYPHSARPEVLAGTRPEMLSDSAAEHLNTPLEALLRRPALAPEFWSDPAQRDRLLRQLVSDYAQGGGKGVLRHQMVRLLDGAGRVKRFHLNSVLRRNLSGRLKWQGTLMALEEPESAAQK